MAITPATGLITPCVCVCVLCGRRNLGGVRGRGGTETTEDRPFPSRGLVARWLLYKEWGVLRNGEDWFTTGFGVGPSRPSASLATESLLRRGGGQTDRPVEGGVV